MQTIGPWIVLGGILAVLIASAYLVLTFITALGNG